MKCYNCGSTSLQDYMDQCQQCGTFVHCCMNCEEYDEYSSGNCKVSGKWENDKKAKNYCDSFKPNTKSW